jgi:hypothetical protein
MGMEVALYADFPSLVFLRPSSYKYCDQKHECYVNI